MAQVLFAADSATKAQRLSRLFAERGIHAAVQHLPVGLTTEGCAYAVAVSPRRFEAARMLLKTRGINVRRVFFYDENGYAQLSDTALWFIGGLLKHAASICAITNPSTNSYKRLVPGFEAPVTIGYAMANRSAVVRIPAYAKAPKNKRFELRNPDATCNPYYAYAAILMAGLDGIKNKIDPHANGWGPYDFNLYTLSDEEKAKIDGLPKSLDEALTALEKDHDYLTVGGVFPERLLQIWIEKKRKEMNMIESIPHPAEFEMYYSL